MKYLIQKVEELKDSKLKTKIDKRLKEFKKINKKSNKEWFLELCFCLLTANWKAKESILILLLNNLRNYMLLIDYI